MRGFIVVLAIGTLGLVSGCGPTFNWREIAIDDTRLLAIFPCKPEKQQRPVVLADQRVELAMHSCDTGGVTLAIGHARLDDPQQVSAVLAHWREAMSAGMRIDPASLSTQPPERLQPLAQLVAMRGNGKSQNGEPLSVQGLWFAQGPEVFMALIYAGSIGTDVAESFFSGLGLQ